MHDKQEKNEDWARWKKQRNLVTGLNIELKNNKRQEKWTCYCIVKRIHINLSGYDGLNVGALKKKHLMCY